jgi:hypothetical protein
MKRKTVRAISNEEFIAKFREWSSRSKSSLTEIDEEVAYISRLAAYVAPIPVSKATKAVMQDFYLEEQMRPLPREARTKTLRAVIMLDAFRVDLRADRI